MQINTIEFKINSNQEITDFLSFITAIKEVMYAIAISAKNK